jgi:hypothetical protein
LTKRNLFKNEMNKQSHIAIQTSGKVGFSTGKVVSSTVKVGFITGKVVSMTGTVCSSTGKLV